MNDKQFWKNYQANTDLSQGPYGIEWGGWQIIEEVSELCKPFIEGKTVMEIGCGGGKWTKALYNLMGAKKVYAFDVHDVSVKQTKEYEPRAEVTLEDGNLYPETLLKCDMVFSYDVLLHLPQSLVFRYMQVALQAGLPFITQLPDLNLEDCKKLMITQMEKQMYLNPFKSGYIEIYNEDLIKDIAFLAGGKVKPLGTINDRDLLFIINTNL